MAITAAEYSGPFQNREPTINCKISENADLDPNFIQFRGCRVIVDVDIDTLISFSDDMGIWVVSPYNDTVTFAVTKRDLSDFKFDSLCEIYNFLKMSQAK